VLGFLLAVLAAVGFEVVLRYRREAAEAPESRQRMSRAYAAGIWAFAAGSAIAVYLAARRIADTENAGRAAGDPGLVPYLNGQALIAIALIAVAAACVGWLWFGPRNTDRQRRLRTIAAAGLPILVAGQAIAFVGAYYPRTPRENFYPTTPTQEFLAAHLGHARYFGADGAIYGSVDVGARLRSLHGHGFIENGLAELVETLPGKQFSNPSTAILSAPAGGAAVQSSVLDRAAVDYYVAPPEEQPFGPVRTEAFEGSPIRARAGQLLESTIALTGPVRGIGVVPLSYGDAKPTDARLSVTLRDASGEVISSGVRTGASLQAGVPWVVPLAGESVKRDAPLTAEVVVEGATGLELGRHAGRPAVSVVSPARDGLKLVYANETVIYERSSALPRARWAATSRVVPDGDIRLQLLGYGRVPPNEVVLSRPGPAAEGKPADVVWEHDGLSEMVLRVRAQGAGYLVLADAIQSGWKATVDGQPVDLVPADHAFVGVNVPAGEHVVRVWYPNPLLGVGMWISFGTVLVLLGVAYLPRGVRWVRRRTHPDIAAV
jgi:hypothetical protein